VNSAISTAAAPVAVPSSFDPGEHTGVIARLEFDEDRRPIGAEVLQEFQPALYAETDAYHQLADQDRVLLEQLLGILSSAQVSRKLLELPFGRAGAQESLEPRDVELQDQGAGQHPSELGRQAGEQRRGRGFIERPVLERRFDLVQALAEAGDAVCQEGFDDAEEGIHPAADLR
jgi:hypothetical protein